MPEAAPPRLLVDDGTHVQLARLLAREGQVLVLRRPLDGTPGTRVHLMPAPDSDGPLLGLHATWLDATAAHVRLRVHDLGDADAALLDALLAPRSA